MWTKSKMYFGGRFARQGRRGWLNFVIRVRIFHATDFRARVCYTTMNRRRFWKQNIAAFPHRHFLIKRTPSCAHHFCHHPTPHRQLITATSLHPESVWTQHVFWCKPHNYNAIWLDIFRAIAILPTFYKSERGKWKDSLYLALSFSVALSVCDKLIENGKSVRWIRIECMQMGILFFLPLHSSRSLGSWRFYCITWDNILCVCVWVCACCGASRVNFTVSVQLGLAPFSI